MDNCAKILMKKLFLTIIIAIATVCGFAQDSISNNKKLHCPSLRICLIRS